MRVDGEHSGAATTKVLKRVLRGEGWHCTDTVYWRPDGDGPYRRLTETDVRDLDMAMADRRGP